MNSAVKEAMKSISIQTKQIAEILDTTSREQTGVPMEHHMQRSKDAADNVASILSDRTQGINPPLPPLSKPRVIKSPPCIHHKTLPTLREDSKKPQSCKKAYQGNLMHLDVSKIMRPAYHYPSEAEI